MISRMKFKAFTLDIKAFHSLHGVTSEIRNKSVVAVTENSDHNRITAMSCLKKVINTVDPECSKSISNVVLWSDSMGTQFRSRFIFQLLAGTMFLNKSLCWFYNEGHHDKVPIDDVGRTIKNIIQNFLILPWNLCHLLLLCTCLNRMK